MISSELAAFIESGISVIVGTRDARLRPDCVRGAGVRADPGAGTLTVFLPAATSERALANLADNGRIARIILVSTALAFLTFSGAVALLAPGR